MIKLFSLFFNISVWTDHGVVSTQHSFGDLQILLKIHLLKISYLSPLMQGIWSHVSCLLFLVLVGCFWMEEQFIFFADVKRYMFIISCKCSLWSINNCLNANDIYWLIHLQIKSRFNFIILNLVVSDFLISSVGVFLDNVGSSLRGRILAKGFCQFEGFFYMLTGKKNYASKPI